MLVITKEFYFSDWLFLYYLARNMEPYLFRQMLLDHIVPEIQSEKNSVVLEESLEDKEADDEADEDDELIEEDMDDHSLNSDDMELATNKTTLAAVNEKRVKFA